jgi:hypothetical protein
METQELQKQLSELKSGLESNLKETTKETVQKAVNELQSALETKNADTVKAAIKENLGTVNDELKRLSEWKGEKDQTDKANQEALDKLIVQIKEINTNTKPKGTKSFSEAFAEGVKENYDDIMKVKKGQKFKMELKAVANMTLGNNLTGDSIATYSGRQAIIPSQKTNFRDLIPTVHSDTGLYVQFRETGSEGSISVQTEGSSKTQIDYDFTEVKVVSDYIAGFARFSKQMARSLSFMQNTLPRLLMRDFFKKENSTFWTAVTGSATGSTTTSETDDVKQIIDWIANQADSDYTPAFGLVNHRQLARLNKALYDTQNYTAAGGVVSYANGSVVIAGIPILPVSWATSDKILLIDQDYLERVETESVVVEFFEQDGDNVTKNLITARIECYEDINLMLPASALYADFGNES